MIPMKVINELLVALETVNVRNGVHFTARFRGDYIYIDKTYSFFTSYYCRIEYHEFSEYLNVQYYNFWNNEFDQGVKFGRNILGDDLGTLLERDIS